MKKVFFAKDYTKAVAYKENTYPSIMVRELHATLGPLYVIIPVPTKERSPYRDID